MNKLRVKGGHYQSGNVDIAGFKHSLVTILCASALVDGVLTIRNVPNIEDTFVLKEIFSSLGAKVGLEGQTLRIDSADLQSKPIPEILSNRIHGSIYLIPTLIGRFGSINIGSIGGCPIGDIDRKGLRPIEHIVRTLGKFGVRFENISGRLIGVCNGLKEATINVQEFSLESSARTGPLLSGTTKTALLAAATIEGTSIIENPYRKAEVLELIEFLRQTGVSIVDRGNRLIVKGRSRLKSTEYTIGSDLMEIMTFIAYSVYLNRPISMNVTSSEWVKSSLQNELTLLDLMGVKLEWQKTQILVKSPQFIEGIDIEVLPDLIYSDSHPFFTLMLLKANAPSQIVERIWKDRFAYASELIALGACLEIERGKVLITPCKKPLKAEKEIKATDLRGAAVLLLAAMGAEGETIIGGTDHLQRGYSDLYVKLQQLGVQIDCLFC
jgi:UDP-N-acetylglucosamine 1-carboxyvinyltransferase